ncbi:uncharacterized protein LOC125445061 [Sphaerodactylus townsendi]|uniref:uncharacterized protein LOC125445061 n=1 Tax=Sphaerodactylus townsendi TaxID=933632 RepID=UPI00202731D8|nr:uncharacterized protein LOC125445061 [Sphaerodactylus townsendi]
MPQILSKSKAPGVDFCGVDGYYYIVRSDLRCYMRATNFNGGSQLELFQLHNSCQGGDHYLAHQNGYFYIIKGDNFRRVSDMTNDSEATVFSLHPDCRGGDHYLSSHGNFYIIFQDKGFYRSVAHLDTAEDLTDYTFHPECKNGLYYWGTKNFFYFLKPQNEWGIQYHRCTDLHVNLNVATYSFHGTVVPFIPGGLAIIQGPAFGRWEALKTISNESNAPVVWSKRITKKMGYNKMKMDAVEKAWKIQMGTSYQAGALIEAIAKFQFSLSAEYGGHSVDTTQENWSDVTETEESIQVSLQPKSQLYIWQYQLGFGKEAVLFCRDMKLTDSSTPSSNVPLPASSTPVAKKLT